MSPWNTFKYISICDLKLISSEYKYRSFSNLIYFVYKKGKILNQKSNAKIFHEKLKLRLLLYSHIKIMLVFSFIFLLKINSKEQSRKETFVCSFFLDCLDSSKISIIIGEKSC